MNNYITELQFEDKLKTMANLKAPFIFLDEGAFEHYLTRAKAANIVHEFIRKVLKEAESPNWDQASVLLDLYDCHTCVSHIAECYVKGIMDGITVNKTGREMLIFDGTAFVGAKEAEQIISRVFDRSKRKQRFALRVEEGTSTTKTDDPVKISKDILEQWIKNKKSVNLVDVRCKEEFNPSLYPGIRNIEFKALMNNPYLIADRPDRLMEEYCFVCNDGYQSQMAARIAYNAGFKKVYYVGLI